MAYLEYSEFHLPTLARRRVQKLGRPSVTVTFQLRILMMKLYVSQGPVMYLGFFGQKSGLNVLLGGVAQEMTRYPDS